MEEAKMDSTQSDVLLDMEPLVNNPSDTNDCSNEILSNFEEFFPESKTMLMSELQDSINKIGEVGSNYVYLHSSKKD